MKRDAFWGKVVKKPGCWEFIGFHDRDGYGRVYVGKGQSSRGAHVMAWELTHHLECPVGHVIRHNCDNPGCVNPEHLRLGTQRENIADRQSRKRQACGSQNGRAKLTEEQVKEIRKSTLRYAELAQLYCVSIYVISDIRRGKTWRHLLINQEG